MAIVNQVIKPLTGLKRPVLDRKQAYMEAPVVDDIFDPLFNQQVIDYNKKIYGNRVLGTLAGYSQMWDNALTGKKGILGPGMGILSTFGRSMDKADDLPLGLLTEGVKAVGQPFGTLNEAPQNPLKNIFRNDYNYEGTGLLAAMGNNMAKLAGVKPGQIQPLTSENYNTFGDRFAGMAFDLGMDPGIMGGMMKRMPNSTVGNIGKAMSNYDDIMANVAGNMAFPGGKMLASKTINRLFEHLGANNPEQLVDKVIKHEPSAETEKILINQEAQEELAKMTTGLAKLHNQFDYDPETLTKLNKLLEATANTKTTSEFIENNIKELTKNASKYSTEPVEDYIEAWNKITKPDYAEAMKRLDNDIMSNPDSIFEYNRQDIKVKHGTPLDVEEMIQIPKSKRNNISVTGLKALEQETTNYMKDLGSKYFESTKYLDGNSQNIITDFLKLPYIVTKKAIPENIKNIQSLDELMSAFNQTADFVSNNQALDGLEKIPNYIDTINRLTEQYSPISSGEFIPSVVVRKANNVKAFADVDHFDDVDIISEDPFSIDLLKSNYIIKEGVAQDKIKASVDKILQDTNLKLAGAPDNIATIAKSQNELVTETTKLNSKNFVEVIDNPPTAVDNIYTKHANEIFPQGKYWNVDEATFDDQYHIVMRVGTPRQKTLFELETQARADLLAAGHGKSDVLIRRDNNIMRLRDNNLRRVISNVSKKDFKDTYISIANMNDQIIKGEDFLNYAMNAEGGYIARFNLKDKIERALANKYYQAAMHNADLINKQLDKPLIQVTVDKKFGEVGVSIITEGSKTELAKRLDKAYNVKGFEDMIAWLGTKNYTGNAEVYNLFSQTTDLVNEKAKFLKAPVQEGVQVHRLMKDLPPENNIFDRALKRHNINIDDASAFTTSFRNRTMDARSVLTRPIYERRYLGDFNLWQEGYETENAAKIFDATFTEGVFKDSVHQEALMLFKNDNYTLKTNFDSPQTVKEALFAKTPTGKQSGNLATFDLVKFETKDGVFTKVKHYNKFSDADIAKAFEEDAMLLPSDCINPIENLLNNYKDSNNKILSSFNHYFTNAYKIGVLANPGWLIGNVSDATFKQIVSGSNLYKKGFIDETAEFSYSIAKVRELDNSFSDIFDNYRQYLMSSEALVDPLNSRLAAIAQAKKPIDYKLVSHNSKYTNGFLNYIATSNTLTKEQKDLANVYSFIQTYSRLDKDNNFRDLGSLTELKNSPMAKYKLPDNTVDKILYGDEVNGRAGVFNNIYTNKILDYGEDWETLVRRAGFLRSMKAQGYDIDKMIKDIKLGNFEENAKIKENLRVAAMNAFNFTNYNNFDYTKVSPLLRSVGKFVPFPTFFLKNIAYWAKIVNDNPQYIDNFISAQESMWAGKKVGQDEFMAEAKGRGAIPLGANNQHFKGILKQSPMNSMFSAFNAINTPVETMAFRTNPALRPIADRFRSPEDIKYRPYSMNPMERNIKKGEPQFSKLAYMFHQLNPFDRYMNTFLRTPKKVSQNSHQLSDFLPSVFQPDFSKK